MNVAADILAIGAHPDDVELSCGGSLLKMAKLGHRTGVLDLTLGELGSRGSAAVRAQEAALAAEAMGLSRRANAGLPDGRLSNTDASRKVVVEFIRSFRPRTVVLPYPVGRHPDHRVASELGRDACFLAGLKNYPAEGAAFKPAKVIYTSSYREDAPQPSFVVDISAEFETKLEAIGCYASQFEGVTQAGELHPNGQGLLDLVRTQNSHYGTLIRKAYGEPFITVETVEVEDLVNLGVASL